MSIKLMYGDCLERMKEIPSGSVDMVLTDPPYGTVEGAGLDGWGGGKQTGTSSSIRKQC